MESSLEFYAVCPAGFERIVSEELKSQGIKRIRPLKGGVAFFGTIEDALRACLWLRSASRVRAVLVFDETRGTVISAAAFSSS